MPDTLIATRRGLNAALAYTLPVLVWLLGQFFLTTTGQVEIGASLQDMVAVLLLVQSLMLVACLPWLMRFSTVPAQCCAIAMLLLVPAPVYAISWLAGAVGADGLLRAMSGLAVIALLLYGVYLACLKLTWGHWRSLLLLNVQLAVVGLCWQYRYLWQQVLTP